LRGALTVSKIRIVVADDHTLVRAGLVSLLQVQSDLELVGEAANVSEVVERVDHLNPDIVLLDLSMPGGGGLAAISEVRKRGHATRFLALTMHDEPSHLLSALAAGVSGYLLKTTDLSELGTAIRAVAKGRTYVAASLQDPGLWEALSTRSRQRATGGEATLSPREKQVLKLLALGHTYRGIADQLHLSEKSVETYRTRLAEKLGIRSRAALVRFALDTGMLDQEIARSDNGDAET
jgi:two-component system, NarL family, response regulator NreC